MSDEPRAARGAEFEAFDRFMRKIVGIPKRELDKKVAAFKRREHRKQRVG